MDSIFNALKENGIELALISIEKCGYYNPKLKIMFINQDLSEDKQKEVILHELGHALNHSDFMALYNHSSFRYKMESEATYYMVDSLIKENDGHFDYSGVLDNYNLGLGWEYKLK